ncbi:HAD family phosphatase [Ginsengibacter hankyongi]|uniref:HAD family phosphatase n=1 Tax=Ginsengibacter hankyongi TaxID=2607284 RepID=A0A5J5INK9_9BACT|nr:HAD family phosphatase [Ginsengibacter hankyongi]KAA9041913.1 HAD family phosphatase [Ginsengibacter hankyongi]
MQKIEAIIFDLGGVILNIDYNLTRIAFEKAGIKNFHEMYSQANADDLFSNLETGKISEDNFYNELNKRTGLYLPTIEIENAWNAMLLTFREKSLDFLDTLKPKYKLFLLSNTNHIHLNAFNKIYLEKHRDKRFEEFFDKAYYSCNMGLRKPNADIYEFVLEENKLEPGKTLFVDDSAQNIEAARALGIQTILLGAGEYIEYLPL